VISSSGGEAQQLTNEDGGVGAIAWAPDGASIAFTSTGPEPKPAKDRKEKYGDFEIISGDYRMNHLWRVTVPAEIPSDVKKLPKAEPLTKGDQFSVAGFSWSPDSKRIAFSASRDPDLGSQDTEQIYVLDLGDLHVRKLLDGSGPNTRPQWSPDGKNIAYVTGNGQPFFYYANRYIAVISADGGSPRVLTQNFDEDANLIDWGADGIYFRALQKNECPYLPARSGNWRGPSRDRTGPVFRLRRHVHQGPPLVCRNRRRAQPLHRDLRLLYLGLRAQVPERCLRPMEGLSAHHARSHFVEIV
jgi:Tol biopolymer transport system component